jgi:hypothetical protein
MLDGIAIRIIGGTRKMKESIVSRNLHPAPTLVVLLPVPLFVRGQIAAAPNYDVVIVMHERAAISYLVRRRTKHFRYGTLRATFQGTQDLRELMSQYVFVLANIVSPFCKLSLRNLQCFRWSSIGAIEARAMRFQFNKRGMPAARIGTEDQKIRAKIGAHLELGQDVFRVPCSVKGPQEQIRVLL